MSVLISILIVLLFIIGLSLGISYLVDPEGTSCEIKMLLERFKKYDIQDQMSLFQESMWVEKVIDSCTTHQQLWNADKLISLLCTKYEGKVKEGVIENIRHRLHDIRHKKYWHVD